MARFDWFVGDLECPHCRAISPRDASTEMHTYLRDLADEYAPEACLGVGDSLDEIDTGEFQWSYRTIQEPDVSEEIRILQGWRCRSCSAGDNWAEIVIRGGVIASVSATPLTREILERSHLIHTLDARSLVSKLTGRSCLDLIHTEADVVQILREWLR